jgi:hypothetical protein
MCEKGAGQKVNPGSVTTMRDRKTYTLKAGETLACRSGFDGRFYKQKILAPSWSV